MYHDDMKTVRQENSVDEDSLDNVLKVELSLNWIEPWKILGVEPSATAQDDGPIGDKLLHFDSPRMRASANGLVTMAPVIMSTPPPRPLNCCSRDPMT